jgi:hypothetical protein
MNDYKIYTQMNNALFFPSQLISFYFMLLIFIYYYPLIQAQVSQVRFLALPDFSE